MAKKTQDNPLPKTGAERKAAVKQVVQPTRLQKTLGLNPNRDQMSRQDKEAEAGRLIFVGIGAAIALVVLLLVVAFIVDGFIRPSQSVATVNGQNISVNDFVQRFRLERALQYNIINNALNDAVEDFGVDVNQAAQTILGTEPYATFYNEYNNAEIMGLRVLDDMVNQRLIEAYVSANNITVTDEQIDAKINEIIGYDPEAVALIGTDLTATPEPSATPTPFVSPTPSPTAAPTEEPTATPTLEGGITATPTSTPVATATPQPTRSADEVRTTFETRKRDLISQVASQAGVSEQTVRDYFRFLAIQDAIGDLQTGDTGETTQYADVRHILVETEEAAADIIAALSAGESFAELAKASSTDTGSGANGGELGWAPISNYVPEFADAVREAEIGAIVGPVESDFGFHIIQVRAREQREATEAEISRARALAFDAWLEELRAENEGNFQTNSAWADNLPNTTSYIYRPR